jgi:hypothetical protein
MAHRPPIIRETQVMGAVRVQVPLSNHMIDLEAMLGKISPRTKWSMCAARTTRQAQWSRGAYEAYFAAIPGMCNRSRRAISNTIATRVRAAPPPFSRRQAASAPYLFECTD